MATATEKLLLLVCALSVQESQLPDCTAVWMGTSNIRADKVCILQHTSIHQKRLLLPGLTAYVLWGRKKKKEIYLSDNNIDCQVSKSATKWAEALCSVQDQLMNRTTLNPSALNHFTDVKIWDSWSCLGPRKWDYSFHKEKFFLLDLAVLISLPWKISLPFCWERLHICLHCFFWDIHWEASAEIIWKKIITSQSKMHKIKYAIVFWVLSNTLSLFCNFVFVCLQQQQMPAGWSVCWSQDIQRPDCQIGNSQAILYNPLLSVKQSFIAFTCPHNLQNASEVEMSSKFSVHGVCYDVKFKLYFFSSFCSSFFSIFFPFSFSFFFFSPSFLP